MGKTLLVNGWDGAKMEHRCGLRLRLRSCMIAKGSQVASLKSPKILRIGNRLKEHFTCSSRSSRPLPSMRLILSLASMLHTVSCMSTRRLKLQPDYLRTPSLGKNWEKLVWLLSFQRFGRAQCTLSLRQGKNLSSNLGCHHQ